MTTTIKNLISKLIGCYKENGRLISVNQLEECCCIDNLEYFKKQGVTFLHPVGIVIHGKVKVGNNVKIFQNVTIGAGKHNKEDGRDYPILGDNVIVYPNSCIIGGITIGDNVIIGAGSVVVRDIPSNVTVAGNPARIISKH